MKKSFFSRIFIIKKFLIMEKNKNNLFLLIDIVHELVITPGDIDFGDDAWLQSVHQFTENNTITEGFLERNSWESLSNYSLNPPLSFDFFLRLAFASTL